MKVSSLIKHLETCESDQSVFIWLAHKTKGHCVTNIGDGDAIFGRAEDNSYVLIPVQVPDCDWFPWESE